MPLFGIPICFHFSATSFSFTKHAQAQVAIHKHYAQTSEIVLETLYGTEREREREREAYNI